MGSGCACVLTEFTEYASSASKRKLSEPARFPSCITHTLPCSETYEYYKLPFCEEEGGRRYKTEDLGEILEGDRLVHTPYKMPFQTQIPTTVVCEQKSLSGREL